MENERIENWDETKDRLREKYPQLTEEDLIYEVGQEQELLRRLQEKLDKSKNEIRKWLSFMG